MSVAEQRFHRIIGYRGLANLVIAIERHAILAGPRNPAARKGHRARCRLTVQRGPAPKLHDDPDILTSGE